MWHRRAYCMPILLLVSALTAPTSFAADKIYYTAIETFDPLGLLGPPVGEVLAPPTVKCPGHEPTGNPEQPCPVGSRTHTRNFVIVSRVDASDPILSGMMTVVLNGNMDANAEGPVWGTFIIALDSGGTWEGTWQGLRVLVIPEDPEEDPYWTATLNVQGKGYGGMVDGMKMMATDDIFTPTPVPIAYTGFIEGRVIDPN